MPYELKKSLATSTVTDESLREIIFGAGCDNERYLVEPNGVIVCYDSFLQTRFGQFSMKG